MINTCHRCGQQFESEHSDYVCDICRLEKIRKRIDESTSYPNCISDLRFLMQKYDEERAAHNEHVTELCAAEQEIERLKRQDVDVIISYALERQRLIETLETVYNRITDVYPGTLFKTGQIILKTLDEVKHP